MNDVEQTPRTKPGKTFLVIFLLITILAAGAYLRLVGLDWDENQHLHPDERFLTMVETAIAPVERMGDYFDTGNSTLNPHNRGYTFYVYGTFPIFIIRYVAEWINQTGFGEIYLVGRAFSALADLLVVFLVFLVGTRLYDRRVGLIASAFAAFSVLQIQQSHFFTVDTFINLFTFLAILFAVEIATQNNRLENAGDIEPRLSSFIWFGIALGMGVASKINAAPVAVVLPAAALVFYLRLKKEDQYRVVFKLLVYMVLAAVTSILVFRVLQPYAFTGPGFFGFKLNPDWVSNIKALAAQTSGDVDFPPALQWARRPLWFSFKNLSIWGLGPVWSTLAWIGFLWMGWRIIRGEWKNHIVLWGWTFLYFIWQSIQWNSTMRYQLLIYPVLAIFAAWALVAAWEKTGDWWKSKHEENAGKPGLNPWQVFVAVIGIAAIVGTSIWAYSFTRIYTRQHTRVEASRWMLKNIPGPINLTIDAREGNVNQPIPIRNGYELNQDSHYETVFTAQHSGALSRIEFPHIVDLQSVTRGNLVIHIFTADTVDTPLTTISIPAEDIPATENEPGIQWVPLSEVIQVTKEQEYFMTLQVQDGLDQVSVCETVSLSLQTINEAKDETLSPLQDCILQDGIPATVAYSPSEDGTVYGINLEDILRTFQYAPEDYKLQVSIFDDADRSILASGSLIADFSPGLDVRGDSYVIHLSDNVLLQKDMHYILNITQQTGSGSLKFAGAGIANESSWDDGLPLRIDGFDPYGGIYQGDLNFEIYWDDNQDKRTRFIDTLDQSDYIVISSSRQWASTTRVPERYPLTTTYYQHLLGCPSPEVLSIEDCYNNARVGDYQGELGFELVKVFQSNPTIGSFEINDQSSEEAFTVYDHPKVFIFRKSDSFDLNQVTAIMDAVDLTRVIRLTPRQADDFPGDLMLSEDHLEIQQQGGTWSELFNVNSLVNRSGFAAAIVWYLAVSLLGFLVYPITFFVFSPLSDKGYPFSRILGMLLLAYFVWLAGSFQVPFTRFTIAITLVLLASISGLLAVRNWESFKKDIKENLRYYLRVELLFLAFFLVGLLIRIGNPDLWHPWKGGEKPMDFSYFNAVLKSTTFPPYDPWFAGGYINYYYFGFVIVGVLVKFLGIIPAVAYNLILPTLFSMIAMGAFSIVWNLFDRIRDYRNGGSQAISYQVHYYAAGAGALAMAVLGNLGIPRMFIRGFQTLAAPVGMLEDAGFLRKFFWTIEGFILSLSGQELPYRIDEWYWEPSRIIAGEHGSPITEFPFFSFLYGDLHAHLIALPITLLVIGWVLAVVFGKGWLSPNQSGKWFHRSPLQFVLAFFIGGLSLGALFPTNTWDFYPYLGLGIVAIVYTFFRYPSPEGDTLDEGNDPGKRWLSSAVLILIAIALLVGFAHFCFQPYYASYGQGYSEVEIWSGTRTPSLEYLAHWGLFLFIIVSWLFVDTVQWLAEVPVSVLSRFKSEPSRYNLVLSIIAFIVIIIGLTIDIDWIDPANASLPLGLGIHTAWWLLPLALWAGILLLRKDISDAKRIILLFIGTALVLTLMVEIIVLRGDIGRMNTVFKFYLQAWTLFAITGAAAFGWLLTSLPRWKPQRRLLWLGVLLVLFVSAIFYPLMGGMARVKDRMEETAPHTLDGMRYMQVSKYEDIGTLMDLNQDYQAIRWMQENIKGSPVIVEANMVEYHWGSRFTIYTGLPGVVGWNWHQRQQRAITPSEWVFDRVNAVNDFYLTTDIDKTKDFIETFGVSYIVYGQLEQAKYPGDGLLKFEEQDGILWQTVYEDRDTVIYQVLGD